MGFLFAEMRYGCFEYYIGHRPPECCLALLHKSVVGLAVLAVAGFTKIRHVRPSKRN